MPHAKVGEEKIERAWQLAALLGWCSIWTLVAWFNKPTISDFYYDFGLCMTGAAAGVIAILYLIVPLMVRRSIKEAGSD